MTDDEKRHAWLFITVLAGAIGLYILLADNQRPVFAAGITIGWFLRGDYERSHKSKEQ